MDRINNSPYIVPITPSDTTVFNPPLMGIRVGTTAGTVVVKSNGQTVTIPNVLAGETIYGTINQVMAASTAVGITGYQWEV